MRVNDCSSCRALHRAVPSLLYHVTPALPQIRLPRPQGTAIPPGETLTFAAGCRLDDDGRLSTPASLHPLYRPALRGSTTITRIFARRTLREGPRGRAPLAEDLDVTVHETVEEPEVTGESQLSLFQFELIMLTVLGVALPVVYWRKIRIHHL
jgi:hypothetical protein